MADEFRQLTLDDMDQLLDVRSVSYQPVVDREAAGKQLEWRLPHSLGVFRGGRLRSVTFMYPLATYVGGARTLMGGLSGVATAPEARRGGLVAQSLRRWYADLHERGIGWSSEHPFEPTFYARLGYQTVPNGHSVQMPFEKLKLSVGVGRHPVGRGSGEGNLGSAASADDLGAEPVGPEATAAMQRIYEAYAWRFSFMLTRDDGVKDHWGWTFRRPLEPVGHFAYLLQDAYAVVMTEELTHPVERTLLKVRDFAYSSPTGRQRLFAFLASFQGQAEEVRLHLPPGDQVALDRAAYETIESPELQVRVTDVKAALEGLSWSFPVRLTLRVSDPDCSWNDGTFSIDLGPEESSVRRVGASEPDAGLDVRSLVVLLTGAATAETLVADGRAEGDVSRLRPLASALSGHPVFKPHNDHF